MNTTYGSLLVQPRAHWSPLEELKGDYKLDIDHNKLINIKPAKITSPNCLNFELLTHFRACSKYS